MGNKKLDKLRAQARQYRYSRSAGFGIPASVAGEELHRIAQEHGHLTSAIVVDEARPEEAALHPAFEWDDSVAGERYRLHQASTLVRAVVVVPAKTREGQEVAHRAYVLAAEETGSRPVYVDASVVVNSPSMFADAIERLVRKLAEAQESVNELQRLAEGEGAEPERLARISLAIRGLEAASRAVSDLH